MSISGGIKALGAQSHISTRKASAENRSCFAFYEEQGSSLCSNKHLLHFLLAPQPARLQSADGTISTWHCRAGNKQAGHELHQSYSQPCARIWHFRELCKQPVLLFSPLLSTLVIPTLHSCVSYRAPRSCWNAHGLVGFYFIPAFLCHEWKDVAGLGRGELSL